MTAEAIVDLVFTALVTGLLGALLWIRLNRLEAGLDDLRRDVSDVRQEMATKREVGSIREFMATRSDVDKLREELAVMRSDLTHVALAVGANRPKPAEG